MGAEIDRMACKSESYVSPSGYIKHWSSDHYIHPYRPTTFFGKLTNLLPGQLVVHEGFDEQTLFRFEQKIGHWGYIVHAASGQCFHPYGGSVNPENGVKIVLDPARHAGALWTYDMGTHTIQHRSGKHIHPYGGGSNPENDTAIVVHEGVNDAVRWSVVEKDGVTEADPFPAPDVFGRWEMINAIINPSTEYEFTLKYRIGKSKSTSNELSSTWGAAAGVITPLTVGAAYGQITKNSSKETFEEARETSTKIIVKPGRTICTWQWVFGVERWNDKWQFQSNILVDTDDENAVPDSNLIPEKLCQM